MRSPESTAARRSGPDMGGVLALVGGGFTALVFSLAALGLLRDQLRIGCSMPAPGTEGAGTWTCSDGIGYILPGLVLGAMSGLVVLVALGVALGVRRDLAARVWFTALAVLPIAWTLAWTWYGSERLVSVPPGIRSTDYWIGAVGPAALVAGCALVLAVIALFSRGRAAFRLTAAAAVGLGVATVLQLGIGLATLASAGLLCAALLRTADVARDG